TGSIDMPAGQITVNFDSLKTCVDSSNVTRKGKIFINYVGKRWADASYFTIQLQNYYRNNTRIYGTITDRVQGITTISSDTTQIEFSSSLTDGQITFSDGGSLIYAHDITRVWYRSIVKNNNEWQITGTADGENKTRNEYHMEITSPLVYRFACLHNKV